jgi:malate dehydrogenase
LDLNVSTRAQTNASIVRDLAASVGRVAPEANILVISNPVNSTVPIVAKTLEKAGVFDPRRVFGVTTLDVVRAARFLGEVTGNHPNKTVVPVVGGHSGATIVPLLSQNPYGKGVSGEDYAKLVYRIQFGGDEVVKAKDGAGSATLSMAYAGAKFTNALLRGLNGEKGVITPTFVKSDLYANKGVDFFSSNVELGVCVLFSLLRIVSLNSVTRKMASRRSILSALSPLRRKNCSRLACPTSKRTSRRVMPSSHRWQDPIDVKHL